MSPNDSDAAYSPVRTWIGRILFFGWGLYCIVTQEAYWWVRNRPYSYIVSRGLPAIAFGIALIVGYGCLSYASQLKANGKPASEYQTFWIVGLIVAVLGFAYSIFSSEPVV